MDTKTRILTAVAAGVLTTGAFTVGVAADGITSSDVPKAPEVMHADRGRQMAMGAGMMTDDTWASMTATHEAIDQDVMHQMHDELVAQLPLDRPAAAEAMQDERLPAMTDAAIDGHASHHPTGS